jgi:hypothetical protein
VKVAPAPASRGPNLRWLKSRPAGALRLAFRLPIYLYRLDLGWLLGHRFLLLVHQGRRSGLLRETVLEVLLYEPATKESVGPEANVTCRSSGSWPRKRTTPSSPTTGGATR